VAFAPVLPLYKSSLDKSNAVSPQKSYKSIAQMHCVNSDVFFVDLSTLPLSHLDKLPLEYYFIDMKKFIFITVLLANALFLSAENITVTMDITGLTPNTGSIMIAVQNEENADNKVKKPLFSDTFAATDADIEYTLQLPEGNYVFMLHQDINNNGEMDTNFFRIPKEPLGMSNYNFKGIPGGFDKHNIYISAENSRVNILVKEF